MFFDDDENGTLRLKPMTSSNEHSFFMSCVILNVNSTPECDALVRMVYNMDALSFEMKTAIEKADMSGDGHLNFEEFSKFTAEHPDLLKPAFDIKGTLQVSRLSYVITI